MIEKDASDAILERALDDATADDLEVSLRSARDATTRFAGNAITQNVETERASLSVTAWFGRRTGTAETDQVGPEAVRATVRRAEENARLSPEDPEALPTLGPQTYDSWKTWDAAAAAFDPPARAAIARAMVDVARAEGLELSGTVTKGARSTALATRNGLRAYAAHTHVGGSCTADAGSGSGWAETWHRRLAGADFRGAARRACDIALAARDPVEVPAGDWPVVLEPAALAALVQWITWSWNARETYAGRTFLSGRLDERIVGEHVTLRTKPSHPDLLALPFGWHGQPTVDGAWIERGKVVRFYHDRFTARERGVEPTPWPQGLALDGGDASREALLGGLERGLLVTRFWYIRMVDPMALLLTGMTRDGTFLVEDGRIVRAVKNLRWNESPLRALSGIEAMTGSGPAGQGWPERLLVPAARIAAFHFDSSTQF